MYTFTGKETGGVEEQLQVRLVFRFLSHFLITTVAEPSFLPIFSFSSLQRSFEKMAEDEFGIDLKEAKAFEG